MSNETIINTLVGAAQATVVNAQIQAGAGIPAGTVLAEDFTVLQSLNITAGEADLYLCEKDGQKFAAKLYRRQSGIKPEVIEALKSVDSPYVARLFHTGEYNGRPLVILPYYKNGSLQGRTFSAGELKSCIIPQINEGLHALHSAGVIHKDLKPSNIMLSDDGKTVSIIDFGISSVREDGRTVLVTSTGMTPEYSAPETFRSLFLEESDYYSFGVTIYELFCGHSPYRGLSPEEIARYTSLQKIPFPENMPEELKTLIGALTYYDITNRKNAADPNRRWTYKQVLMWLDGTAQQSPGTGAMPAAYKFLGERYTDTDKLARALAENWSEGKKQLFRGLLSGFFRTADPEIAGCCIDAEEAAERTGTNEDVIFFKTLYKISPKLECLCWRGRVFASPEELGREILTKLRAGNAEDFALYGQILANRLLSLYYAQRYPESGAAEAVGAAEDEYSRCASDEELAGLYFRLGYLLVPKAERCFVYAQNSFPDLNALVKYLAALSAQAPDEFDSFCEDIFDENDNLDPQFEAWLCACGKSGAVERWKNHSGKDGDSI